MKYLDPKFSVQVGGDAYAEGWERIFNPHGTHGRGTDAPDDPDCPCRRTAQQRACADAGCGFCTSAARRPHPGVCARHPPGEWHCVACLKPLPSTGEWASNDYCDGEPDDGEQS